MARVYGMDVAGKTISQNTWATFLADKHIGFAIVRCYRNHNNGIIDDTCADTIANAVAAGVPELGVYHFPVIHAKTPEDQANETLAFLTLNNINYSTLWLDVETGGADWHGDTALNVDFIDRFIQAVVAGGGRPGIYTGSDVWTTITGNATAFQTCPLWWSSHGKAWSDHVIGGWTGPTVVQYAYDHQYAGVTYDSDYRETD